MVFYVWNSFVIDVAENPTVFHKVVNESVDIIADDEFNINNTNWFFFLKKSTRKNNNIKKETIIFGWMGIVLSVDVFL